MKHFLSILTLILFWATSFGQLHTRNVFDTSSNDKHFNNSKYYSKTDFTFIDTLEYWNYKLDNTYKGKETDSIKPFGQLIFWRTRPIDDGKSKQIYGQLWTPYITFDIYNLADSIYCYEKSNQTRFLSSCVAPDVGGDLIIIDKFIFLNSNVCLSCQRHDTKFDYCRPVVNIVFANLGKSKFTTLQSLVNRFIIKKGDLPEREKRKTF